MFFYCNFANTSSNFDFSAILIFCTKKLSRGIRRCSRDKTSKISNSPQPARINDLNLSPCKPDQTVRLELLEKPCDDFPRRPRIPRQRLMSNRQDIASREDPVFK